MKFSLLKSLTLITTMTVSLSVNAIEFDRIFVFGDSWSDGGLGMVQYSRLKQLRATYPTESDADLFGRMRSANEATPNNTDKDVFGCSYQGRQTNGLTLVEQAAVKKGMYHPDTFFNYAVSGANSADMLDKQLDALDENFTFNNQDLIIINIGANDLLGLRSGQKTPTQVITQLRANIESMVYHLVADHGASKFVLMNMANYTRLPDFVSWFKDSNPDTNFVNDVNTVITTFNAGKSGIYGYTASDIQNATNGIALTAKKLLADATNNNIALEIKIFDLYYAFDSLLAAKGWPVQDVNVYDDSDAIIEICQQMLDNGTVSSAESLYNLAYFDKFMFFDRRHLSRRGHLYIGTMLGKMIQE